MKKTCSADGHEIELLRIGRFAIRVNVFKEPDIFKMPAPQSAQIPLRSDIMHNHEGITIYSFGFMGGYREITPSGSGVCSKIWRAPWFRVIRPDLWHSLHVVGNECRTLLLTVDEKS